MIPTGQHASLRERRGVIAIFAALCLVVVIAFVAFSVDWGYVVVTQSELQNAADAGALSGARVLSEGRAEAIAAAQLWAGKNIAAGRAVATLASEDVEIGVWNDDTASFTLLPASSSELPNAVRVTCRRTADRGNPLNLFFAHVLGVQHANVHATTVAVCERETCGMIVGLDYVDVRNGRIDSYDSRLGSYSQQSPRQHANVCSDGPITIGSGMVYGNAHPGEGYTVNRPGQVTGSTTPRTQSIKWKPVALAGANTNNNNSTLSPSQFRNGRLQLSGGQVCTLIPGTYYFPAGMELAGSSRVVVTGPTRIVMGGYSAIAGNGIANNTGLAANLRIEILNGGVYFAGGGALVADIYGPTTHVFVDGNSGFFGVVFAKTVTLTGSSSSVHGDEALKQNADELVHTSLKQ